MVVYQKWFEVEIARWKVRRPRYDLSKQLKKIHMQQHGKMGSGARSEEAIPEGRRDVTRRALAAGICPYYGSEQVAKALPRRSFVRENGGYRRWDELPQHRRTERRCTSSLSASGRDAAGSLTNAERERPRSPCVRWCDERQTHFPFSPRQSFYILYMPLRNI